MVTLIRKITNKKVTKKFVKLKGDNFDKFFEQSLK